MTEKYTDLVKTVQETWDLVAKSNWLDDVQKLADTKNDKTPVKATKDVYLAGGWFTSFQEFSLTMAVKMLSQNDTVGHIHVPILHQYKGATIDDPKGIFGNYEWGSSTFSLDTNAMDSADVGVVMWDPTNPDEGTAWEQGYLFASKKPVVLTVPPEAENYKLNLMTAYGLTACLTTWEMLRDYNFTDHKVIHFDGSVY